MSERNDNEEIFHLEDFIQTPPGEHRTQHKALTIKDIMEERGKILRKQRTRIDQLETALMNCWGTLTLVAALREQQVPEEAWAGMDDLMADALREGADVMGFTPEIFKEELAKFEKEQQEQ